MQKVYLAGGLKSGWQIDLVNKLDGFDFINPLKRIRKR